MMILFYSHFLFLYIYVSFFFFFLTFFYFYGIFLFYYFFGLVLWVFPGNYTQYQFVVFLFPPSSLSREEILGRVKEVTAQDPVTSGTELAGLFRPQVVVLPRVQAPFGLSRVQASAA